MPFILNPTEDTHEFMMKLKESLRSDLQHGHGQGNDTALPSNQDQGFGDTTIYTAMDDFWKLFESGITRTTVTCQACQNVSWRDDPFDEILLKFPDEHHTKKKNQKSRTISLDGLLDAFCGANSICTIEDRECSTCNMRTAATKQEDIISYPRVLMIVLE
jgi:ubiquitin C-terminal hydrolase